jgi:predicted Zn-dependent protease with MMP-like domain
MDDAERARFDALFEVVLATLPTTVRDRFEDVPVVIDDVPDALLQDELHCGPDDLCGLHTGVPLTQRSIEDEPTLPDVIQLFRCGIIAMAGGWTLRINDQGASCGGPDRVQREIRITLLHELGHHFGLDEDDLERLGYD